MASKLQAFWNHPAGPKTIHFWLQHLNGVSVLPMLRTSLSLLKRYPILSKLLWLALESFGLATVWLSHHVNVAMAGTGLYQLSRKIRKYYFSDEKDAAASLEG